MALTRTARDSLFDLWLFCSICGLDKNSSHGEHITVDQIPMLRFIEAPWGTESRIKLLLSPRNTLKTTCGSAYLLQQTILFPEQSSAIICATQTKARAILHQIKTIITSSEGFKEAFGDNIRPSDKSSDPWNADRIFLTIRQEGKAREANISATSLEGDTVGYHFSNVVFCDDLSTATNAATHEGRQGVIKKFREITMLAESSTRTLVTGTYWSPQEELYSWIEANEKGAEIFRVGCWADADETEPLFPNTLDEGGIARFQSKLPVHEFAGHFLLRKISSQQAWFAEEDFGVSPPPDIFSFNRRCAVYIGIDPAGDPSLGGRTTQKKTSDFWAGVAVAWFAAEQKMIILDGVHGRGEPSEQIDALWGLIRRYPPTAVVVEKTGQSFVFAMLRQRAARDGIGVPIVPKVPRRNKAMRTGDLQPWARARMISFSETCEPSFKAELLRELVFFGNTPRNDLSDALYWASYTALSRDFVTNYSERETASPQKAVLAASLAEGSIDSDSYAYWNSFVTQEQESQSNGADAWSTLI